MARAQEKTAPKDEALQLVLDDLEDAEDWHREFSERCDRYYRIYRALLEEDSPASEWAWQLHPPYARHIAETIIAGLRDEKIRFQGKPRPRLESDLAYMQKLRDAARAQEYMINSQLDRMGIRAKTRPFVLQDIICGLSAYKTYWRRDSRTIRRREQRVIPITEEQPVLDDFGEIVGSEEQVVGSELRTEVVPQQLVTYDDPYIEVVDVRDLWWRPRGARSIERVNSITHRVWITLDELREKEKAGIYRKGSADKLSDTKDYSNLVNDREQDLFRLSRTKDMIEILERWTRDRVITVANREVVLSDSDDKEEKFPFWHGDLPFTLSSITPDLFIIPGISVMEDIGDLQEGLWSLTNQRLDNTELLNNASVFYREDVNPDDIEIAPRAKNRVPGDPNTAVMVWTPNPISAQISIPAEQAIRGDMQNISAAAPFAAGTDSQVQQQETATGVSIITTLAQRILASKKSMLNLAHERVLEQMAWLNRQFQTQARVVELVGSKGAEEYLSVRPEHWEPDIAFEIEPAEESLMRQERRAESQALLQMALEAQMIAAMSGEPLDIPEFIRHHLRNYEIDNPDRFFLNQEEAAQLLGGMQQQAGGQANGQQPPFPGNGGGVTSPLASAPTSPSNANSLAGGVFGQRFRSQGGRQQ